MSRKDYEALARILGETLAHWDFPTQRGPLFEYRTLLIEELEASNPRFDASKFRMAVQAYEANARRFRKEQEAVA